MFMNTNNFLSRCTVPRPAQWQRRFTRSTSLGCLLLLANFSTPGAAKAQPHGLGGATSAGGITAYQFDFGPPYRVDLKSSSDLCGDICPTYGLVPYVVNGFLQPLVVGPADPNAPGNGSYGSVIAGHSTNCLLIAEWVSGLRRMSTVYLQETRGLWLTNISRPDPQASDGFGSSLASLGNDFFVVGAPRWEKPGVYFCDCPLDSPPTPNLGRVYLYSQARLTDPPRQISNPTLQANALFGTALARVEPGVLAVGAPGKKVSGEANAGAVYLFANLGNGMLTNSIDSPEPSLHENFGQAVSRLGRNRFLVGAPRFTPVTSDNRVAGGRVYLYDTNSTLIKMIRNPNPPEVGWFASFGQTITEVGGGRFIVGAPLNQVTTSTVTNSLGGYVYIFDNDGNLLKSVPSPQPTTSAGFGYTLTRLGDDRFAVSWYSSVSGAYVVIFDLDGNLLLTLNQLGLSTGLSTSLASLGTNTLFLGASGDQQRGRVYIYDTQLPEYLLGHEIPRPANLALSDVPANGPTIDPPDGAFWHRRNGLDARLYATRPGSITISWSSNVIVNARNVWAKPNAKPDYQGHVANCPPVDLSGGGAYAWTELRYSEPGTGVDASTVKLKHEFAATNHGRSLLMLSAGPPSENPIYFQYVRTANWKEKSGAVADWPTQDYPLEGGNHWIGQEITDTLSFHEATCGGPFVYWANSFYCADANYYDRTNRTGPIIPVNTDLPTTDTDDMVLVGYQKGRKLVDPLNTNSIPTDINWPWRSVRYDCGWGRDITQPDDLIIATSGNSVTPVANAIDNDETTEYRTTDKLNAGFVVDPGLTLAPALKPTIVNGLALTLALAGNHPERDPTSFKLEGINDGDSTYTLIASNSVPEVPDRHRKINLWFQNTRSFRYYWLSFPTIRDPLSADSMQIAEVELLGVPANDLHFRTNMIADVCGKEVIDPGAYPDWDIYVQNDPNKPGCNPNDEHAVRMSWGSGEAIFPLRDDLWTRNTSLPYVLMKYRDPVSGSGKMEIFQVFRNDATHPLRTYARAGTLIQAPFPLTLFPTAFTNNGGPVFIDRKGNPWAAHAADNGGTNDILTQYWYPMQTSFYYPTNPPFPAIPPPSVGALVPWLDPWLDRDLGTPGTPINFTNTIYWADNPPPPATYTTNYSCSLTTNVIPRLRVAETLVRPKFGLPDISSQSSVEVLYQQATALDPVKNNPDAPQRSVAVIDPTQEREVAWTNDPAPADLKMENDSGLFFFSDLPPSLRSRLFYDPINFKLKFRGQFNVPPIGEYYLLLNKLSDRERYLVSNLTKDVGFKKAVAKLATDVIEIAPQYRFASFSPLDLANLGLVASKLKPPVVGATNTWLAARLSQETQDALLAYQGAGSDPTRVQTPLLRDLNALLTNSAAISSLLHIQGFTVRPETQALLDQHPQGFDLRRLNRMILEDAYPEFPRNPPFRVGFDSLALTAGVATGQGYVVVAFANDTNTSAPAEPISLEVMKVVCPLYQGEIKTIAPENPFEEKLTLRHSGDFGGNPEAYRFEWYYKEPNPETGQAPVPMVVDPDTGKVTDDKGWHKFQPTPDGVGAVDITFAGTGVATLIDQYFVCHYQPTNSSFVCGTNWSEMTPAHLAEGYIKRVVTSINQYEQRIKQLKNTSVNSIVSMLSQAGPRWTGNVALNLKAANKFGLIEIYETVLNRGRMLSIEAGIDFPAANDALLLVASRISDFYMLLGNEAYADAQDPTIAFGVEGQYGDLASSIHCFMNQTPTLLEEELALLRGRDVSNQPGVENYPVYNHLIWNFTHGTDAGELAYALNYNIRNHDGDVSGTIDEADAKVMYPQGHGDAWGHYLTAVTTYYKLLRHPSYTWVPRPEAVDVGGVAVSVDFLDERKFAAAAAAKAKAGAEIVNLTYRQNYVENSDFQWRSNTDTRLDPKSTHIATPEPRAWGVSDWASRAGQGAYFDWVVANSMLPANSPSTNGGIQKIDRTTVTELREIPAAFLDIQSKSDMADLGMNPLGLAKGALPFDIDPAEVAQGKTHFEQIYGRALAAMNNAVALFNYAENSTQWLRRQADTVDDFQVNAEDREVDFTGRLIEIFGYAYASDIGPAGTYPSGYNGPDLFHYDYVDVSELMGINPPAVQQVVFPATDIDVDENGALTKQQYNVTFNISRNGLGLIKPAAWTTQRRAPGEIQFARSDLLQAKARFEKAVKEYDILLEQIDESAKLLEAQHNLNAETIQVLNVQRGSVETLNAAILRSHGRQIAFQTIARVATLMADGTAELLPKSVGLATDVTAPARGVIKLLGAVLFQTPTLLADAEGLIQQDKQNAKELVQLDSSIHLQVLGQILPALQQLAQLEQLVRSEAPLRLEIFTLQETMQQAAGRYLAALAKGQRLLEDRLRFRQQTASKVQVYRYKDMAFRIFRNDALQKYRAQFDLAATYAYLAASAFDYETSLLPGDARGPGQDFMTSILRSRSLGTMQNGQPLTGSGHGDPGLADPLARMWLNWSLVLKGQLGFNNPQTESGRFSLRSELFRTQTNTTSTVANSKWREVLSQHCVSNLLVLPEFQRYCIPFYPQQATEPAIVIPFATTINFSKNFFGNDLGGGDNDYDSTHFATKVRSVGVWFANYNNLGSGMVNTPRVYLIPVGMDTLRSPSGYTGQIRTWKILDQMIPVPFPSANFLFDPDYIPMNDSLFGEFGGIRKYARFRAYHDAGNFNEAETVSDTRLICRSVWNTRWLLIIPGRTLNSDADEGIRRFIHGSLLTPSDPNPATGARTENGVSDIKLFFQTYAY